ncbi:MAG: DUF4962 domain-containing protein, partial [Planctomycetota bacterium]
MPVACRIEAIRKHCLTTPRQASPIAFMVIPIVAAVLIVFAAYGHAAAEPIHPEKLDRAMPADGSIVERNPPSLRWPAVSKSGQRYRVRLSRDPEFPPNATITSDPLPWAVFTPHQQLDTGTWYWQYTAYSEGETARRWSPAQSFQVTGSARLFVTPPAEAFLAGCPTGHPRIPLAAIREPSPERLSDADRQAVRRRVQSLLGTALPSERRAAPSRKGSNEFEAKNFAKWSSKAFAAKLLHDMKEVVWAYGATGDERIGREVVRRGLHVAGLDPTGPTARTVSDFADGSCIEAMALAYDYGYDLMTQAERATLREALVLRTRPFFQRCINNLETRVFSAHIWQHILWQATQAAVALRGDQPEADQWLAYVYELWIARFPPLSRTDGGWANGLNYFATNFHTMRQLPGLMQRWTGYDFFDHPWYRNTPYYLLYCWPPGSSSDGFGDGSEREGPPPASYGQFAAFLAHHFQDPYAGWYAQQVLKAARSSPSPSLPDTIRSP